MIFEYGLAENILYAVNDADLGRHAGNRGDNDSSPLPWEYDKRHREERSYEAIAVFRLGK